MEYVAHRRFRGRTLSGDMNIPAKTELDCQGDIIFYDGKALCYATSENAHQYFARNDDGNGMLRGRLTQSIQKRLAKRDAQYQQRWSKVWSDPVCRPYKRPEHEDYWLWSHAFFNAGIGTLKHIAELVGA